MTMTPTVLIAANGILNDDAFAVNSDFGAEVFDLQDYVVSNTPGTQNTSIMQALHELKTNWNTNIASDVTDRDALWAIIKDYKFLRGNRETATETLTTDAIQKTDPHWVCQKYYTVQQLFTGATNKTHRINYLLQQFEPICATAERTCISLEKFKNAQWEDISLDIKSHDEIANNGLLRVLLTGSDAQIDNIQTIKDNLRTAERLDDVAGRRLAVLSKALRNVGTLFDANDLANMGKAKTLIENMYRLGLSQLGALNTKVLALGIDTLDDIKEVYLLDILKEVTGKALEEVIEHTGVVLPDPKNIKTLADLLDQKNLFSTEVLDELPDGTLVGLAVVLDQIPGSFQTLKQVADMLDDVEIPVLSNLPVVSQPLPTTDYTAIINRTPIGSGPFGNPILTDFMVPITGTNVYRAVKVFNKFNEAVETLLGAVSIYSLAAVNQGSQTTDTWRNNFITALNSILSSTVCTYWLNRCEQEYTEFYRQTEVTDKLFQEYYGTTEADMHAWTGWTDVAGTNDTSYASSSRLVSGLHQFGVDTQQLGYNETFVGIAKENRYGDAIKASLAEGRMGVTQAQKGAKLASTFDEAEYRIETNKAALTQATEKRKSARLELDKMIDDIAKGITVDSDLQNIIRLRVDETVTRERSLARAAGVRVNPFLK